MVILMIIIIVRRSVCAMEYGRNSVKTTTNKLPSEMNTLTGENYIIKIKLHTK